MKGIRSFDSEDIHKKYTHYFVFVYLNYNSYDLKTLNQAWMNRFRFKRPASFDRFWECSIVFDTLAALSSKATWLSKIQRVERWRKEGSRYLLHFVSPALFLSPTMLVTIESLSDCIETGVIWSRSIGAKRNPRQMKHENRRLSVIRISEPNVSVVTSCHQESQTSKLCLQTK